MVLHHSQDVFQIAEGIQVIRFRCFCDAVDDRTGFCAVDTVDRKRSIMSTLTNVRPLTWPVVLASPVCGFCLAASVTMEADLPEMTGWFDPDILEVQ